MEIKGECGNCGQHFLLDETSIGQQFVCPNCHQTITARAAAPGASLRPIEVRTNVKQGAAAGGWICFVLGVIILFIPLPTWYVYGPLFLVSLILSVVAMAQGRIKSGISLLLANLIGVPILFVLAIFFGLATWGVALHELAKNDQPTPSTNGITQPLPVAATVEPVATNTIATTAPAAPATNAPPPSVAPAPTSAYATIAGAFGRKLGDVYDPDWAINTSKLTDGTPIYEFDPGNSFRTFDHYYILITPTTHKIYSIWATESLDTREAAEREQSVVMAMLQQKYGPETVPLMPDTISKSKAIDQSNRWVITRIDGYSDVTLSLRYGDGDLEKLEEQERIANEVKSTDKTGL